jgi:hypothetical protein
MKMPKSRIAILGTAMMVAGGTAAWSQPLPLAPNLEAGLAVVGVFEGWFTNPDGSYSLLYGYFNRNQKENLDIPIGPTIILNLGDPIVASPLIS